MTIRELIKARDIYIRTQLYLELKEVDIRELERAYNEAARSWDGLIDQRIATDMVVERAVDFVEAAKTLPAWVFMEFAEMSGKNYVIGDLVEAVELLKATGEEYGT